MDPMQSVRREHRTILDPIVQEFQTFAVMHLVKTFWNVLDLFGFCFLLLPPMFDRVCSFFFKTFLWSIKYIETA